MALKGFAEKLGLELDVVDFLNDLPPEVQSELIDKFDSSGSKDGNVLGRLQGYARHLLRRSGVAPPTSLRTAPKEQYSETDRMRAERDPIAALPDFAREVGITAAAEDFLSRLPQEVLDSVIGGFDPSGTKDGNVWGRLLGYVRSRWVRFLQLDKDCSSYIRSLPEETQLAVMVDFDPHGSKDGNLSARLEGFVRRVQRRGVSHGDRRVRQFAKQWSLNSDAEAFMNALPEAVQDSVVRGFDGRGTKDGNVWGRLLGYTRQMWTRWLGLDSQSTSRIKDLPEEAQILCMTTFDPSTSKDGNIGARLEGFMNRCLRQTGNTANRPPWEIWQEDNAASRAGRVHKSHDSYDARRLAHRDSFSNGSIDEFLERCGLTTDATEILQHLPEDILQQVLREFDHTGTKDGNVFGRLEGYVRSLCRKRGVQVELQGVPRKRSRV